MALCTALILSPTQDIISWDTLRLEQLIDNYVESSKFFNLQNKCPPSLDMLLKLNCRFGWWSYYWKGLPLIVGEAQACSAVGKE